MDENTKSQILSSRYAYESNELVLVNALDLCEDIIKTERIERAYKKLLKQYQDLSDRYLIKFSEKVEYRHINLRG